MREVPPFLKSGHKLLVHLIVYILHSHHSRKNRLKVVQWLIKNAKLNHDTAGYVLRWACG